MSLTLRERMSVFCVILRTNGKLCLYLRGLYWFVGLCIPSLCRKLTPSASLLCVGRKGQKPTGILVHEN